MVKRYDDGGYESSPKDAVQGKFVLYSDYLKLKEALGEALDGWEDMAISLAPDIPFPVTTKLRKEFDL